MAKKKTASKKTASKKTASQGSAEQLTLSEVGRRTNISMPTLQKYKKLYADRIPSSGEGRTQRYPAAALPIFRELYEENMARRGRPRKGASARKPAAKPAVKRAAKPSAKRAATSTAKPTAKPAAKPAAKPKAPRRKGGGPVASDAELLSLKEVSRRTGIAYATLQKYVKLHGEEILSVGEGRLRRYRSEALDVFRRIRASARVGRPPKPASKASSRRPAAPASAPVTAPSGGMRALISAVDRLEKRLARLEREVAKPLRIEVKR